MNVVLTWLFLSFFFGFVVALVLCVKPAPEQQRLDDAIGFLRDHAEVRTAEFQFFFSNPSAFSFASLLYHVSFTHVYVTGQTPKRVHLHFLLITAFN